jgi:hypothetical protein
MLVRQHIGLQLSACLATTTFGATIPLNFVLSFYPLLNDVAAAFTVLVVFAATKKAHGRNGEI